MRELSFCWGSKLKPEQLCRNCEINILVTGFEGARIIGGYRVEGKLGRAGEGEWIEAKLSEGEERAWEIAVEPGWESLKIEAIKYTGSLQVTLICGKKQWEIDRIVRIDPHEGCQGRSPIEVRAKGEESGGSCGIRVKGEKGSSELGVGEREAGEVKGEEIDQYFLVVKREREDMEVRIALESVVGDCDLYALECSENMRICEITSATIERKEKVNGLVWSNNYGRAKDEVVL